MREWFWRLIASIVVRPRVFAWLQRRGEANPYTHIGPEENRYMYRYWIFNPYGKQSTTRATTERTSITPGRWARWGLPSIRLHHIMRPDNDRHLHDHPWNARTIVCHGHYVEERPLTWVPYKGSLEVVRRSLGGKPVWREVYTREVGYTGRLLFGQYHRISHIPPGGVWTLFFTWKFRGEWGFDVDGTKIVHHEYLKKNDI